ncbi:superoxide dismutase [Lacticaseibacillus paracasei]|uniref:superoxide dismutase n=1 Tax=Lacticaseibacillus paracasei TaxID=1597 RepID=UPI000E08D3F8|nr:superoxide dismutase [Lacticaseibacillus paracasei]RDF91063.1 superoxide dismutase [Lacticaseibacillus paracasei]
MTFVLPDLPFDYAALEPYIDATTMHLHHDKHHQTYIDKLNASLDGVPQAAGKSIEQLLTGLDALPESVRVSVRNNGGGHYNHSLFWTMLSPESTIKPDGQLLADLESTFDSFDKFKAEFSQAALSVFGSGWAWLVKDNATLKIVTTANQDSPITYHQYPLQYPLLGLDVWEHAYYLHYQNRRPEYVDAFFKVINWQTVENRLMHPDTNA